MCKLLYILCMFWMLFHLKVNGQLSRHETVARGLRFQVQADSVQRLVDAQVLALSVATGAKKNDLKNAIRDHEALIVALQKKANEWFDQVTPAATGNLAPIVEFQDSIAIVETMPVPGNLGTKQNTESEFAILSKSPYSAANPVPVDIPLPDGVVYKIQLGAFSKPLAANAFKGLTPVSGETLDNGVTKYYAGLFRRFTDADLALRKIHEYGFRDAFIIAFYNRKTINIGRARQLEAGY